MAEIRIKNLQKRFADFTAVSDSSLVLQDGKFVVPLGRAIVREPKAFLMDEPLGTLDAEFRELMCVELRKLHERLKTTTVFVTHDQNEAMALADHIVVMNKGDILQADDPHGIYNFP